MSSSNVSSSNVSSSNVSSSSQQVPQAVEEAAVEEAAVEAAAVEEAAVEEAAVGQAEVLSEARQGFGVAWRGGPRRACGLVAAFAHLLDILLSVCEHLTASIQLQRAHGLRLQEFVAAQSGLGGAVGAHAERLGELVA